MAGDELTSHIFPHNCWGDGGVNIHQPFWCEPGPQGFVPQPKWVYFFQLHREQQERKGTTNSSQYLLAMFSPHCMRFGQDPTVRACAILENHSCDSCFLLTDGQGPDGWMLVMLLQNSRHPTLEASKFNQCPWCVNLNTRQLLWMSFHRIRPDQICRSTGMKCEKHMLYVPGLFLSFILMLMKALLNSVHGVFGYCFRESICFVSTIHVLHVFTHASDLVDGSWGVLMVTVLWLCVSMCHMVPFSPQLCVGFLFLILSVSRVASSPPPPPASSSTHSHTQLCHIPSLTHTNLTHNFVTYHLSHTKFHIHKLNIQLCHIPSFHNFTYTNLTHNFVTYHLSHTRT